jgi:hypothetical protein
MNNDLIIGHRQEPVFEFLDQAQLVERADIAVNILVIFAQCLGQLACIQRSLTFRDLARRQYG